MPTYNKLVRDKIPQIIMNDGKEPVTKVLNQEEYKTELRNKSQEELQEYLASQSDEAAIEELADLLEIIHAIAKVHRSSIEEVEKIRQRKVEERGGFEDKIFLIEVEIDD